MKPISPFGLPFGITSSFWGIIGLVRLLTEKLGRRTKTTRNMKTKMKPNDIAVVVPAHNEEVIIRQCIKSLKYSLRPKQIYVVSDGSSDKPYRRARMEGCHVSRLNPGRGKARALKYLFKRFHLFKKYQLIFIVDADNRVDKNLIPRALPFFNDPEISVVTAATKIHWPQHIFPRLKWYFVSYRDRLNRLLVYFYIYGQTWKYTNVNYVIPGFCTIYRSKILKQLEIDTPGLLIEDFNLAFQLHRKKLGKIAYHTSLIGWEQYPDNLKDYWKQVRRWNIGFFQTIRQNGIWPSFFWLALGTFSLEVTLNSIFIVLLPLLLLLWIFPSLASLHPIFTTVMTFSSQFGPYKSISLRTLFFGTFLMDYWLTIIVAWIYKRPQLLIYGLFFFFMHYVTSLILLTSIIPGFFRSSEGRWISPTRREV